MRHLSPGTLVPLPADVGAVRIRVLGPPLDTAAFGIEDSPGETYRMTGPLAALHNGLALGAGEMRVRDDAIAPFDEGAGLPLQALLQGPDPTRARRRRGISSRRAMPGRSSTDRGRRIRIGAGSTTIG